MSFPPRRVVTGHDDTGRAVVQRDDRLDNPRNLRPGHESYVIWTTDSVPADSRDPADGKDREVGRALERGTVFRITRYEPGVASSPHETESIDYAVVLAGEIEMVLDDETVKLSAGDVVVQRATRHDWRNTGTEPCLIAFCLVGAESP
jgi:quercetin dioxygenase-like cupin family protein